MPLLIRLISGLLNLGLIVGLLVNAPGRSAAAPPGALGAGTGYTVTLSPTEWKAARLATRARNIAVTKAGEGMDYRDMRTIFGNTNRTQVDWRRQMAAGFRQSGGTVKYLSAAENRAVEAMRKRIYGKKKPRTAAAESALKPNCAGRSETVRNGPLSTTRYLDRCETLDTIAAWASCVAAMGVISHVAGKVKRLKWVDWPAYSMGAFCGMQVAAIALARDKSDINAVYFVMRKEEAYQPYPGQVQYAITTHIYSQ